MLYLKFTIQDASKFADFQQLFAYMVMLRQPGFTHEEDDIHINWDNLTEDEIQVQLNILIDFENEDPAYRRYKKVIPPYADTFFKQYLQEEMQQKSPVENEAVLPIFNYLEYGFEVDMDKLEQIDAHTGVVAFSTGNYPFGGIERFMMTLKAYDLGPVEGFDGFNIVQFEWLDPYTYNTVNLPEKTEAYIAKFKSADS